MRVRPALLAVVTFLALILVGTGLLYAFGLRGVLSGSFLTAAFTAVSAVCVTGLTVVDLSRDMDFTGQLLVLILLQVGGLGVLTLSNWILLTLRRRMGLRGSVVTRETYGGIPRMSPRQILTRIVVFTFVIEALGAAILLWRFSEDHAFAEAAWLAVFHAVSAFCNAGFSLFSDSLAGYHADLGINITIMFLIIAGGIGFVAAVDIAEWLPGRLRGNRRKLLVHTRVVLRTSSLLIGIGFLLFIILEWKNTFRGEAVGSELLESLFLSVTARTAGFNTVATGHLTNMTLLVLILLMAIGASPGSCGGGVKTTTMAILWARTRSHLLNRPNTELLGRTVPRDIAAKAMAIFMTYILVALLALVVLQATEYGELPHDQTRGTFLEHLFEVISALSTVGLSTGITTRLSDGGLAVLMVCMFVGRVGPLVLAVSLIGERPRLDYTYPQGDIMVG